ncbi:hypothetical protein SAMN02910358_01750 [Lachnospiraceae bacterium XBB1006]|nr:hypothetical protein SAMN02910358_01750 [Lachnospiraceae bacterium XBB1006]
MSKTKSITELVEELQNENESLKMLAKLANQYCKSEFGYDVRQLHQLIEKFNAYERKQKEHMQNKQQHIQQATKGNPHSPSFMRSAD